MVKNLPSNARDTGSIPGQGTMIPHTLGQLNPCAATRDATPKCCNEDPVQSKQNMNSDHFPSPSKLATAIPCGSEGIRVLAIAPKPCMVRPLLPSHLHLPPLSWVSILSSHTSHQTTPPTREAHFHCRVLSRHSLCLKKTFLAPFKDMGSFFLLPRFAFLHSSYCKFTWYPVAPYYCR